MPELLAMPPTPALRCRSR